ncbi:hypothetical protein N7462_000175 [Penicillium macrosclerotiorum]|uniref:uncharacterized protein n=1 Tax=Penicillium macrosclerotiorum TaxID=303699 RepID=UPI002548CC88|nr:uncharacterized protein N7462_000175 [Penicillium macrosclerotiorum]KAJ5698170.1 hypothetical protein N7462_000175 [Penicillium macrosclerotiorum]
MEPLPENHKSKHPELAYDVEPNYQPSIKVSVYFRKRDGISSEQFHKHWETVHADLAAATQAFQNHILRYVQHHQTPDMKARAASLGEIVLEYDGCAQLWVRSWSDWQKFYNSAEYTAALSDDWYENLVVGDASGVIGGKDGMTTQVAKEATKS